MDEFSSHGDVGKLTEEFWMVGGRSRFFIGASLTTDALRAIMRHRLLDVGGLASVSRSSGSGAGISMLIGVPGSGLPAGSEMLRLKLSLRLSRRSCSPPSPAKHGGADEDEVDDSDDDDDDVDDDDVDIDDEKQLDVGDSTDIVGLDDPDATETVSMFRVMDSVHGGGSDLLLRTGPRRLARAGGSNLKSEQVAWCDVVVRVVVVGFGERSGEVPVTREGRATLRDI